jgi:hypothetical protein
MREIKFRGKANNPDVYDFGKWVYGDLVHNTLASDNRTVPVAIKPDNYYPIEVDPKTIGECVRLCDCADKKEYLYSGDIISYNNTDSNKKYIGVIKYDGELCCFAIFDKYADIWERESDWMKIKNIKKLGNVFDNPELI